jgi:imidazole glycerol-phosphate synthase subunit HisF
LLKTRLIPSILLKRDRLVKSTKFTEFRNIGNPINMARVYNAREVDELVVLDIEASKEGRGPLLETIAKIADECFMPLTIGGGIKTLADINNLLKVGADKVAINTAAVADPNFINEGARTFGKQCIVVSIDVKKHSSGTYEVFTESGYNPTGLDPVQLAKQVEKLGAGEIFLTSIDQDGSMEGYDLELLKKVSAAVNIPVIASGGVGSLQDFADGIIQGNATAVSAASVFHFTDITPLKAKSFMKSCGIDTRV